MSVSLVPSCEYRANPSRPVPARASASPKSSCGIFGDIFRDRLDETPANWMHAFGWDKPAGSGDDRLQGSDRSAAVYADLTTENGRL
ncbi:hypothetical protein MES5069_340036 [Mesorhizobium escarrei]|uniref:Uncharacterized protein n=1 Tax=Mesorhizobium escarrei TaxID=666018 RepID=A0ABM9E110_9HYPH|nr:hypothetical protein MES5069_340036 [Mesorhizobium escarrei]